jgi:Leishmanolysin
VVAADIRNVEKDVDLILFFTVEDEPTNAFLAWAAACSMHRTTMRPVVGRVNFNLAFINDKKNLFFDNYSTTLHEIYHVLGFSMYMYQFFIDPVTFKRKPTTDTYFNDVQGPHPHFLRSPLLLAHAKEHFKCDTIKGVPIEDNGSSASLGSHLEKTTLGNEAMSAIRAARRKVSTFIFKLLEDSGWYKPNYDMVEPLFFGKDQGCSFFDGKCKTTGPGCTKQGESGCYYDYTYQSFCSRDAFTNGCMFMMTVNHDTGDCKESSNYDGFSKQLGEFMGFESRCFTGRVVGGMFIYTNMCYKNQCRNVDIDIVHGD